MNLEQVFARNLSEALGILAAVGVLAGLNRWRSVPRGRRLFLLAFIVSLAGMAVRELPVSIWGVVAWPAAALWLSALGRAIQVLGAGIFMWAAMKEHCGPVGCLLIFAFAFTAAFLL